MRRDKVKKIKDGRKGRVEGRKEEVVRLGKERRKERKRWSIPNCSNSNSIIFLPKITARTAHHFPYLHPHSLIGGVQHGLSQQV